METRILGKDDLLSGATLKRELVPFPEFGVSVWIRQMSAEHVIEFRKYIDQFRKGGAKETTFEQDIEIMKMVISFSVCDESGSLLFASPEEAKDLARNNVNLLMEIGSKALAFSKMVVSGTGLTSEVADNLPKAPPISLSENSPRSSRKRGGKS